MDSHFWYEPAYRALYDSLPTDRTPLWVEVGVFQGAAIKWLLREAVQQGRQMTVDAIDDFRGWQGTLQGQALRIAFCENVLGPHPGVVLGIYSVPSPAAANLYPDNACDVVWLDADHSYDAVKADIAAWYPKVKPGGALGGDDWAWSGGGVKQAVEEAFPKERIHLINGEREGQIWPSWIVRKPITPNDS